MRTQSIPARPMAVHLPKPVKKQRDPYDGLRPWSAITHGTGAVLGIAGTAALLILSGLQGRWDLFLSFGIYGLSMICLYTASTLYHCIHTSVPGRIALRKYDHCSIYLLIAGSYTPVCTAVLKSVLGTAMLTVIWVCAAAGIILTIAKLAPSMWSWAGSLWWLSFPCPGSSPRLGCSGWWAAARCTPSAAFCTQ